LDTAEDQGAFTLVPGFHNRIENWLNNLAPGTNPREQDLYALGAKPIAANAGDFIIWHQALPHGSSPNTALLPRFVQYINYEPLDMQESGEWI
jgi:ectoine hydroxylase-related dioxygenase (phytanoyl-CoA dioxygenase family)